MTHVKDSPKLPIIAKFYVDLLVQTQSDQIKRLFDWSDH